MVINNPLLIDIPMPIHTKRLIIRPFNIGDGKILFEAIEETREQLQLWFGWVKNVTIWQDSELTARKFCIDYIRRKALHLAILKDNHFIGVVGCHTINWHIPSSAIGYWCRQTAQGQGYIQEAATAVSRYAFEVMGMKRLTITCEEGNIKSIRVAERLGFKLETRAKGLIVNQRSEELAFGHCYTRFDALGLAL